MRRRDYPSVVPQTFNSIYKLLVSTSFLFLVAMPLFLVAMPFAPGDASYLRSLHLSLVLRVRFASFASAKHTWQVDSSEGLAAAAPGGVNSRIRQVQSVKPARPTVHPPKINNKIHNRQKQNNTKLKT